MRLASIAMLMCMLIDAADPRYGGSPDPDDERRRRWEPIDNRVLLPFAGSVGCLVLATNTEPAITYSLTLAAVGLCASAVRAAWPREKGVGPEARGAAPADADDANS